MINYSPHAINYKKHDCCLSLSFSFFYTHSLSLCYLCNYIIFIQTISRETCLFECAGTFIIRVLASSALDIHCSMPPASSSLIILILGINNRKVWLTYLERTECIETVIS